MEKNDWKKELLCIMKIFHENGIDVSSIPTRKKDENGKRQYIELKDLVLSRSDLTSIMVQNGFELNFKIGHYLRRFKSIYNGSQEGDLSEDERRIAEKLGIVKKVKANRQPPKFKGCKISDFHLDIIRNNIDRILSGELSNVDIIAIINELATQCDETPIYDNKTVKRMVEIVLEGKPEELKKYYAILEQNSKKHLQRTGRPEKNKERDSDYVDNVIHNYLPRYLRGEITLDTIVKELKTSIQTVDRIITKHYVECGDSEGLEQYHTMKKTNGGTTIEKREAAKKKKQEAASFKIVSNAEFLLLSPEEQEKQLIMKCRQGELKEVVGSQDQRKGISSEEAFLKYIERIKEYFRSKNDLEKGIENFSEQDIRYIIFRYPTILGRSKKNLDEKFELLTSYDGITTETACGMIKTFPGVIGYSKERSKSQLDILQKENLIEHVISSPIGMMRSVEVMYALIQYAKQRHGVEDLGNVELSNIFMSNSTLKKVYGVTYTELKNRFPYENTKDEDNTTYPQDGETIGKATYTGVSIEAVEAAECAIQEAISLIPGKNQIGG